MERSQAFHNRVSLLIEQLVLVMRPEGLMIPGSAFLAIIVFEFNVVLSPSQFQLVRNSIQRDEACDWPVEID